MGLFARLDAELQKDLVDFVKSQEARPYPHVLGDTLAAEILKEIISGNARISGCVTNHGTKRMYLEFSFFDENADGTLKRVDGGGGSQKEEDGE